MSFCTAGNAFLAADSYSCHVHGIDLSVKMILVAILTQLLLLLLLLDE
jgi:hypothetical protein